MAPPFRPTPFPFPRAPVPRVGYDDQIVPSQPLYTRNVHLEIRPCLEISPMRSSASLTPPPTLRPCRISRFKTWRMIVASSDPSSMTCFVSSAGTPSSKRSSGSAPWHRLVFVFLPPGWFISPPPFPTISHLPRCPRPPPLPTLFCYLLLRLLAPSVTATPATRRRCCTH